MKAYKIELLIIDHDNLGGEEIANVIEQQKYPNWCISPSVMEVTEKDIGVWYDDHPLNKPSTHGQEYKRIFSGG